MSILETAKQVVALEKRIGSKLDMAEYIEPDEYDGEEIDEANTLLLAYGGDLAAALVEAEGEMNALIEAASCIRHWHDAMQDGSGMVVSKEHVFKLWTQTEQARAFLSRISTASSTLDAIRDELGEQ